MLKRIGAFFSSSRLTGEAPANPGGAYDVLLLSSSAGGMKTAGSGGFIKMAGT